MALPPRLPPAGFVGPLLPAGEMSRHANFPMANVAMGVEFSNAFQVAAVIEGIGLAAAVRSGAVIRHYLMLLETRIKANASGAPGPEVRSGDYRRSWTHDGPHFGAGTVTGTVGTNKPQARRLEYGFVGQDILGRSYDQAPRPHVGPAFRSIEPEFVLAMEAVITP